MTNQKNKANGDLIILKFISYYYNTGIIHKAKC